MGIDNYVNYRYLGEYKYKQKNIDDIKTFEKGIEFFHEITLYAFLLSLSFWEMRKYYKSQIQSKLDKEAKISNLETRAEEIEKLISEFPKLQTEQLELVESSIESTRQLLNTLRPYYLLKGTQHLRFQNETDEVLQQLLLISDQ